MKGIQRILRRSTVRGESVRRSFLTSPRREASLFKLGRAFGFGQFLLRNAGACGTSTCIAGPATIAGILAAYQNIVIRLSSIAIYGNTADFDRSRLACKDGNDHLSGRC